MILKSVTIFLCIVISLTVCQYFENQYPEFIYTLENVTYFIDTADDSIATDDQPESRIAGGNYVDVGYFPFMVVVHRLLGYGNYESCAGTIISRRWVLTAAHCVMHHPQGIFVAFGVIDKSNIVYDSLRGPPGVSMIVTQVFIHPYFKEKERKNDIALLYMPQDIPSSDTIQPIKLAYQDEEKFVGYLAYVAGWGKDGKNRKSKRLKYIALPIISNRDCKLYWDVNRHQICTAPGYLGDACLGDNGGPLFIERNGRHLQIGIVSYGDNPCPGNKPEVYTKVSSFTDWISDVMNYDPESHIL